MKPITTYADEQNWVEEWKKEYKYGVILILPPEPHYSKVTEIRNKYAWAQSCCECGAHISLSVQIPRPVTGAHIAELKGKLANKKPFTVKYGPVVDKPFYQGVMLDIHPQDTLKSLQETVESTSLFEGAKERKHPYWAHMTIAERATWEQTFKMIDEVKELPLSGQFRLEYLSYVVPDNNYIITERERIYLGRKD